jgi:hypothetical protein
MNSIEGIGEGISDGIAEGISGVGETVHTDNVS